MAIKKGSVIVADCGFHSAALGYLLDKKGYSYVIRVNEENATRLIKELNFKNGSVITEMPISSKMAKNYDGLEGSSSKIKVRIIKIRGKSSGIQAVYIMSNMYEPKLASYLICTSNGKESRALLSMKKYMVAKSLYTLTQ